MTVGNVKVTCGTPALAAELERGLALSGFTSPLRLHLLVDAPSGFAFAHRGSFEEQPTLVLTDNPCPEYLLDLRDAGPVAVLAGGHSFEEVQRGLERAAAGERFYHGPEVKSCLSGAERRILRYLVAGYSDKRIARQLGRSEKTIGNQVASVLKKLHINGRCQAVVYYLSLHHLRDLSVD
ncbi:hypothetical protein RDMS_00940 [Deinococcus sp. RL]|uniref:helix-turn-helix transcriptional regulator n=1 Tax=Deinococcus sp. RL TaxID=1489678 RepID=UPI0004D57BE0|nr:LuxR C-terminal-related transcriptional regulator [Deinococcus sp. RL]KEF35596.1 hypothetical protein RDMS_00940 [Deinococcus sp. RL]